MSSPWRLPTSPPPCYTFQKERECSSQSTDCYAESEFDTQESQHVDRHKFDEPNDQNAVSQRRGNLGNQSEEELVGSPLPRRQRQRITTGGRAPRRLTLARQAIYEEEQAAADAEVDEDDPEDPRSNRFKREQAYQNNILRDHPIDLSAIPAATSAAKASSSVGVMTSSPPNIDPTIESTVEGDNKTLRQTFDEAGVDEITPEQLSRSFVHKQPQVTDTSSQAITDSFAQKKTSSRSERQSPAAVRTSSRTNKTDLTRGDSVSGVTTLG